VSDRVSGYELTSERFFAGAIGDILTRILAAPGVMIPPEWLYMTAVVSCAQPLHRFPRGVAVTSCRERLWDELRAVEPVMIVTLGDLAASALFPDDEFSQGEWKSWGETPAIPTYRTLHPREALWQIADDKTLHGDGTSKKRIMWSDWCAISARFGELVGASVQKVSES
jgi:uracil-DNA glycosylase family 4